MYKIKLVIYKKLLYSEYMGNQDKSHFNILRILTIFGIIFASSGVVCNFYLGTSQFPFNRSIFYPHTNIVVPVIHTACALLGVVAFIFPEKVKLLFILLLVESVHLVLTGFQHIGVFIYATGVLIMFLTGYGRIKFKRRAIGILLFWLLLIGTLIPYYGFFEFVFALSMSGFVFSVFYCSYHLVKKELGFLVGDIKVPMTDSKVLLPQKGGTLELKEIGLTERQIACVHYTIDSDWNYKQIASELITSESTVKKEMQELYRIFGVKNREMLRLLLIQYKIV